MSTKGSIYFFLTLGSILGGWLPSLWGEGGFSLQAIVGSFAGGIIGIWVGYKIGRSTNG